MSVFVTTRWRPGGALTLEQSEALRDALASTVGLFLERSDCVHFLSPLWAWPPVLPIITGHLQHQDITEDFADVKQYYTRYTRKFKVFT